MNFNPEIKTKGVEIDGIQFIVTEASAGLLFEDGLSDADLLSQCILLADSGQPCFEPHHFENGYRHLPAKYVPLVAECYKLNTLETLDTKGGDEAGKGSKSTALYALASNLGLKITDLISMPARLVWGHIKFLVEKDNQPNAGDEWTDKQQELLEAALEAEKQQSNTSK